VRLDADAAAIASQPATAPAPAPATTDDLDRLRGNWGAVIAYAGAAVPLLKTHLKQAEPVSAGADEVRIAFPAHAVESLRICAEELPRRAIQNALRRQLGRTVRAVFEPRTPAVATELPPPAPAAAPEPPAPAAEAPLARPAEPPTAREAELRAKIINDPAVRKVLEMFDGSITDITP